MPPELDIILILVIVFAGVLVQTTFGFGSALVMMPLLVLFVDLRTVTPLVAMVAVTLQIGLLAHIWREVQIRSAWRLVLSSAAGIPIGAYCLRGAYDEPLKLVLGLVILGFGAFQWTRPQMVELRTEVSAYLFGFLAGILGGAYNTNGPPVVIYGRLRRWPPETFRATLQGYFFPTAVCVALGHAASGLWTDAVLRLYVFALPATAAGVVLGNWLHRRLPAGQFDRWVYGLLIGMGLVLVVRTTAGLVASAE